MWLSWFSAVGYGFNVAVLVFFGFQLVVIEGLNLVPFVAVLVFLWLSWFSSWFSQCHSWLSWFSHWFSVKTRTVTPGEPDSALSWNSLTYAVIG